MTKRPQHPPIIYTLGHSTRSLDEFVALLRENSIRRVLDIRTIPRSRHNPQFNRDTLSRALHNRRIGYRHMKDLGGLRRARPDSPNSGWENASFRGFADYMQTSRFEHGLERAIGLAIERPSVLICAEAVPWRCHRSLVADALTVRGFTVVHILGHNKVSPHTITRFARVDGVQITYPRLS